ncbi:hypothetical protein TWF281_001940 [Arthrobotrys megalospora]
MDIDLSPFERLPDELISHIVTFLDIPSLISLHRVSSRIRSVSRFDGLLWRAHCFPGHSATQSRLHSSHCPSPPKLQDTSHLQPRPEKVTLRAQWYDALEEGERRVDWYKEYQYRHATLSDNSFIKFQPPDNLDIVDITIAGGNSIGMDHLLAASALGDGSVCIFSLSDSKVGSILGRSKPDLLARKPHDSGSGRLADSSATGIHNERGLFVDAATAHNCRAWFGAGSVLTEVDLTTMQRIRTHRFPFSVTCLSTPTPVLVVGTTLTLHLLDSRSSLDYTATASVSHPYGPRDGEKVDPNSTDPNIRKPFTRLNNHPPTPPSLVFENEERNSRDYLLHAPPTAFLQPSPLSILHSPIDQASGNELYVAGRFPSIMAYDRRQWPRLAGTIHSGARLSSLAIMTANPSLSASSKYALIACGEYAGRGTLEIYPLPMVGANPVDGSSKKGDVLLGQLDQKPPSVQQLFAKSTSAATRNRQSASRSKIFSIANQGIKIVTGDSEGRIRFMERDGIKHIRDWVSPWDDVYPAGGCVKKILPILQPRADLKPSADNGDLLLHIGEEAGVLTFNPSLHKDQAMEILTPPAQEVPPIAAQDEETYLQAMRTALESHSSDLQFLRRLGR